MVQETQNRFMQGAKLYVVTIDVEGKPRVDEVTVVKGGNVKVIVTSIDGDSHRTIYKNNLAPPNGLIWNNEFVNSGYHFTREDAIGAYLKACITLTDNLQLALNRAERIKAEAFKSLSTK